MNANKPKKHTTSSRANEKKRYERISKENPDRLTYEEMPKKFVDGEKFSRLFVDGEKEDFLKCSNEICERAGFLQQAWHKIAIIFLNN